MQERLAHCLIIRSTALSGQGLKVASLQLITHIRNARSGASFTEMTNPITVHLHRFPLSQTSVFESGLVAKLVGKLDGLAGLYPARIP